MPPIERVERNQKAVLWERNGYDADGQPTVSAGVEISVRWDKRRSDTLDGNGNTIILDATVVVGQEVKVGSIMWQGKLADFTAGIDTELYQVAIYKETPDLKGRNDRRVVGLVKHRESLPTLA